jgi:hypothetical protein
VLQARADSRLRPVGGVGGDRFATFFGHGFSSTASSFIAAGLQPGFNPRIVE